MIKAIFFDIDGTLLSHKTKRIPDSTMNALKQLKEKEILIFLATGRHSSEMKKMPVHDIEFDGYITLNGQYCYHNDEVLFDLPIVQEDIENIIKYVDEKSIPCIFVEDKEMYINFNNEVVEKVQESISTELPTVGDIHRGHTHKIYQVIPYNIDENEEKTILSLMPHCKKTRWHPLAIDIIPATGGKQNGIEQILKHYHISREETMAFGDGMNDMDMLEYVHTGIAMGNASDELKKIGDDVTDDIDDDGIYNALKKYELID